MELAHVIGILCLLWTRATSELTEKLDISKPGHGKPLGFGPFLKVDEVEGFPSPDVFISQYAIGSKPMKMKNAARLSPSFALWTDDYFLNMEVPNDSFVNLETIKKESRSQDTIGMDFKEFIQTYNKTEHYMVDNVPTYLGKDLLFPCSLQCPHLIEKSVVAAMMWLSSGGTNSVLHADAVDNINCLFRGEKTFTMIDVNKYRHKVDLDHAEGLYSSVDVDDVDYAKFPGLADVEYYQVNVSAGDCLYIPYRWFHQVRSYGSNLAVNIWWDHYSIKDMDLSTCSKTCDRSMSIDKIVYHGMDSVAFSIGTIKDQIINQAAVRSIDLHQFQVLFALSALDYVDDAEEKAKATMLYNTLTKEFFDLMDVDGDGSITVDDLETVPEEAWWDARTYVSEIEQMFEEDDEEEVVVHDEL